jgi:thiaminase/transcriptional activator TenA
MKFSEKLYTGVDDLWREAADKPFVREMALGTLTEKRFRNYMIQDYLYLLDYIEILSFIRSQTEDEDLSRFLLAVINETESETYRVHLPHMRKIGVSDEEIATAVRLQVISEYTEYMREQVREHGFLAGLTALLQCSWLYAYIGEKMTAEHPEEIAASPYRFWFDAYTCKEYTDANQMWIDALDRETEGISDETAMLLNNIFRRCAEYENKLWDALF